MPRKAISPDEWRTLLAEESERCEKFSGRVCVNVSGGAASAIVWQRCLDWYGPDRVVPVFADTSYEHPDLYRFLDELEKTLGQTLHRLVDGRNIWDVFIETGMHRIIRAGGACKASFELKQKPLRKFFDDSGCDAVAVGIEFLEGARMRDFKSAIPCQVLFPLTVRPYLSACEIIDGLKELDIDPPVLYRDGYAHNNCGGFCILAGLGQWAANRTRDPEGFKYAADKEAEFIERYGFTVLRDQRDGQRKPYSLRQLADDQDNGRAFPNDWRSGCQCMTPTLFTIDDCF